MKNKWTSKCECRVIKSLKDDPDLLMVLTLTRACTALTVSDGYRRGSVGDCVESGAVGLGAVGRSTARNLRGLYLRAESIFKNDDTQEYDIERKGASERRRGSRALCLDSPTPQVDN